MSEAVSLTTASEIFVPRYHVLQEIRGRHERAHWVEEEMDMRVDVEQWKMGKIDDSGKAFVKMILRLFTQSDVDVCSAYVDKLIPLYKNPDVRMMLLSFAARETTHVLAYKKLNDTLGYDSEEFMSEFLSFSEMKEKHEFMIESEPLDTPADRIKYLAKQVLMEGVNLFGPFSMLLSFSQSGGLPGTVSGNKWSVLDESMHVEGLCALYHLELQQNPSVINNFLKADIYECARTVVAMEDKFIDLCFSVGSSPNITAEETKAYIRYVCDYRMQQLGLKPQFGVPDNPIPWIDEILSDTFGNFFETTVVQYSKGSLEGEWVY